MSDTRFVGLDVKYGDQLKDSYMLKLDDDKIADVVKSSLGLRLTPDQCLEYRLENGATKEEFVGKSVDDFKRDIKAEDRFCTLEERPIGADDFSTAKINENMLVFRGEHTAAKFLEGCGKVSNHETIHRKNAMVWAMKLSKRDL